MYFQRVDTPDEIAIITMTSINYHDKAIGSTSAVLRHYIKNSSDGVLPWEKAMRVASMANTLGRSVRLDSANLAAFFSSYRFDEPGMDRYKAGDEVIKPTSDTYPAVVLMNKQLANALAHMDNQFSQQGYLLRFLIPSISRYLPHMVLYTYNHIILCLTLKYVPQNFLNLIFHI